MSQKMKKHESLKAVALAVILVGLANTLSVHGNSCCETKHSSFAVVKDPKAIITDRTPAQWILQWTAKKDHTGPVNITIIAVNSKSVLNMAWDKIESIDAKAELLWDITKPREKTMSRDKRLRDIIAKFRIDTDVKAGDAYKFAITATGNPVSGSRTSLLLVAGEDFDNQQGPAELLMYAGPANKLDLIARPSLQKDGKVRVVLVPVEPLGYPSSFTKPLPVTVFAGKQQIWKGSVQKSEQLLLKVPDNDVVRLTAKIKIADTVETITSNPIWPARQNGKIATFGDFHWHTELSGDGTRGVEEGLIAARDYINLDFASPSDHTPKAEKWIESVKTCDRFDDPGNFVAMYAWEQSSLKGHVNFYFLDSDHPMNPDNFNYPIEPEKYIENLPHKNFVAIPHHSNAVSYRLKADGTHFWTAYPWGEPADEYLRQIEIIQSRGNMEREIYPDGWRAKYQNNGGSAQTGLAKGHKLGFIGSTDNHTSWPSVVWSDQYTGKLPSRIFAGVWAKDRTRKGIYNSLYNRHTWACWDTRAIVLFEINSAMQGDELTLNGPQKLTARIKMAIEAPLDVLEIVTENDHAISANSLDDSLDIDTQIDLGLVEKSTFFYLRARQTDGAIIYASPVFIKMDANQ
ncbi:MAG: PHP domain-containing protein [Planctomycetota bacterium]|jgi:hypothetical protein